MPADIDVTGKTRGGRQIWLKVLDSYLVRRQDMPEALRVGTCRFHVREGACADLIV
jgi:hypothetical protein